MTWGSETMSEIRVCDCGKVGIPGGFGPLNDAGAEGVRVWNIPPMRVVRRRWSRRLFKVTQPPAYQSWHHPSGCRRETTSQ